MKNEFSIDLVIKEYSGIKWRINPEAAKIFAHQDEKLPIRFLKSEMMKKKLTETYYDYFLEEEFKCVDDDGEWIDINFTPFAAIGYLSVSDEKDDGIFLDNSFGFLFYDAKKKKIIYATTDEWTRDNVLKNIDLLGIHKVK
jgi:hypothetical protein